MNSVIQNLYGLLPPDLVMVAQDAHQYSPLLPGSLALEDGAAGSLGGMAILAPAGTLERRYILALALRALRPGAALAALAPKDKGGARLKKELQAFGCEVAETAKRHMRICHAARPDRCVGVEEAIAAGAPRLIEALGFWSQPGIFSWDRLDPGSVLLLRHLPVLSGKGADLGCGFGFLARQVLTSPQVTHVTLVDIDRRAVQCAQRNNDDPRAVFIWDSVDHAVLHDLDFVVMNPPFHRAGLEDRELGQGFIARAHAMLRPGGVCWLTANIHLPYEKILTALFTQVTLKAEADGFKIFQAVK